MKHLIAIILVVSIATIVVEGRHNRHSGWGRHEHECKTSCFAHCLAGTTAEVNDFCNLTGFRFTFTFFSRIAVFNNLPYIFWIKYFIGVGLRSWSTDKLYFIQSWMEYYDHPHTPLSHLQDYITCNSARLFSTHNFCSM